MNVYSAGLYKYNSWIDFVEPHLI